MIFFIVSHQGLDFSNCSLSLSFSPSVRRKKNKIVFAMNFTRLLGTYRWNSHDESGHSTQWDITQAAIIPELRVIVNEILFVVANIDRYVYLFDKMSIIAREMAMRLQLT